MAPSRHVLLLSLAVLVLYSVTLAYGFVWDDTYFVAKNASLRGAGAIPRILASGDAPEGAAWNPYYRPLTTLSFAAGVALFGENPAGHHAMSVLAHLGVVLALYFLGRRLLDSPGWAFAAALLFALHPANTEPAAFVSARGDLLCALFCILALLSALRYLEAPALRRLLLSTALLSAALLSKEPAVILPALAFLLARRADGEGGGWRSPLPWAWGAAVVAYLVLRGAVLPKGDWGESSFAERLASAGPHLLVYLRRALFPAGLSVFYPAEAPRALSDPAVWASWGAVAALAALLALSFRKRPAVAVGGAWFLLALLPVSGLLGPLYPSPMADRYLYVPLAGGVLALAAAARLLLSRLPAALKGPKAAGVALSAAALLLAFLSMARLSAWRDSLSLWLEARKGAPGSDYVLASLGAAYIERGRGEEAREALEEGAARGSGNPDLMANLALVRANRGEMESAEAAIRVSVGKYPANPTYLKIAAWILDGRGKREEALSMVRNAERLAPGNPRVGRLLALLTEWEGKGGTIPFESFDPI